MDHFFSGQTDGWTLLTILAMAGVTVVAGALDPGLAPAADVTLALTADGSPAGAATLEEVGLDALV